MPSKYPRFLFWTDLEATGLPVRNDYTNVHLLEVAVILTDFNLNPLIGYTEVVGLTPPAVAEIRANQFVRDMHTKSGLIPDAVAATKAGTAKTVEQIESEILDILGERGEAGDFMIAGSGVAAYDHPLIKTKMPTLAEWMAYYPFDIGVMRRTSKILVGKEIVSHTPASYGETKTHRALDDVKAHLEEATKYQQVFREAFGA